MNAVPPPARGDGPFPLANLRRLHATLMPDYNRRAALAWWLGAVAGGLALVWSGMP